MIVSFQYTIPAGGVGQVTTTRTPAKQILVCNSAAHSCRVGDSSTSSTLGIQLLASNATPPISFSSGNGQDLDLSHFYVAGTAGDKIDFAIVI